MFASSWQAEETRERTLVYVQHTLDFSVEDLRSGCINAVRTIENQWAPKVATLRRMCQEARGERLVASSDNVLKLNQPRLQPVRAQTYDDLLDEDLSPGVRRFVQHVKDRRID